MAKLHNWYLCAQYVLVFSVVFVYIAFVHSSNYLAYLHVCVCTVHRLYYLSIQILAAGVFLMEVQLSSEKFICVMQEVHASV